MSYNFKNLKLYLHWPQGRVLVKRVVQQSQLKNTYGSPFGQRITTATTEPAAPS